MTKIESARERHNLSSVLLLLVVLFHIHTANENA